MTPEQKEENYRLAEQLIAEQNFPVAVALGLLATCVLTAVWIMVAASTGLVSGYMATAMGAGVGYVVQVSGKGIDDRFAVVAMGWAMAGCVAGNILVVVFIEAIDHQMPVIDILEVLNFRSIVDYIFVNFGLLDLMFWILTVSAAGYVAKRRLARREQLALFTYRNTPPINLDTH